MKTQVEMMKVSTTQQLVLAEDVVARQEQGSPERRSLLPPAVPLANEALMLESKKLPDDSRAAADRGRFNSSLVLQRRVVPVWVTPKIQPS